MRQGPETVVPWLRALALDTCEAGFQSRNAQGKKAGTATRACNPNWERQRRADPESLRPASLAAKASVWFSGPHLKTVWLRAVQGDRRGPQQSALTSTCAHVGMHTSSTHCAHVCVSAHTHTEVEAGQCLHPGPGCIQVRGEPGHRQNPLSVQECNWG